MARYGKKSQETVKVVMEEFIEGKLKSGKSGTKVTNRTGFPKRIPAYNR